MRALLQEDLGNGKIRCNSCAHRCELSEGQVGICRVRQHIAGQIEYLADTSGWIPCDAIDHCNAGSYCAAKPGCSWSCTFCTSGHQTNPEISMASLGGGIVRDPTFPDVAKRSERPMTEDGFVDRKAVLGGKLPVLPTLDWFSARAAKSGTPDNKALLDQWRKSGRRWFGMRTTEPSIHLESVREVFSTVKAEGGNVFINTNGYWTPEMVTELAPLVDFVDVGIKGSANARFLRRTAGVPDPAPIFDTIGALVTAGCLVMVSDIPVHHHAWRDDLTKLVDFISSTILAPEWPRLLFYPWFGRVPWESFGHFKPGLPVEVAAKAAMIYSRSALLAEAAKLALGILESVWIQLPSYQLAGISENRNEDFFRRENMDLGNRLLQGGYSIAGEGLRLRVARSEEELGSLYAAAEILA